MRGSYLNLSISFVNLYTELATVIRLAVVVVFFFCLFFFKIWHPDVYNCHNNNNKNNNNNNNYYYYYIIIQLYSQFSASYLLKYTKTIIILDCSNSLALRKFNTYTK